MTAKLLCGFAVTFALLAVPAPSFAETVKLPDQSQNDIKTKCNAVGGDLLGVSDLGSYGCDNGKNGGGMVLCNKDHHCTGYTKARTSADIRKIASKMRLKTRTIR